MTIPAVHCEARKAAYRQSKEGLVVSFVIHPNDMPDALAVAPLGQRYMLALAAIGDDELPVDDKQVLRHQTEPKPAAALGVSRVDDKPVSAASQRGRERYTASPPMEQALVRAARLCKEPKFWAWIVKYQWPSGDLNEDTAKTFIRQTCCNDGSRGMIAENQDCYRRYLAMETEFKMAVGEMAEVRR